MAIKCSVTTERGSLTPIVYEFETVPRIGEMIIIPGDQQPTIHRITQVRHFARGAGSGEPPDILLVASEGDR